VSLKYAGGAGGDAGFEFTAKRRPNGDFEFPAVPPGSYVAIAYAEPPRRPTTDLFELFFAQSTYTVSTPVQVDSTPLENVQLVLARRRKWKVTSGSKGMRMRRCIAAG
jgi:hypothetical protein